MSLSCFLFISILLQFIFAKSSKMLSLIFSGILAIQQFTSFWKGALVHAVARPRPSVICEMAPWCARQTWVEALASRCARAYRAFHSGTRSPRPRVSRRRYARRVVPVNPEPPYVARGAGLAFLARTVHTVLSIRWCYRCPGVLYIPVVVFVQAREISCKRIMRVDTTILDTPRIETFPELHFR